MSTWTLSSLTVCYSGLTLPYSSLYQGLIFFYCCKNYFDHGRQTRTWVKQLLRPVIRNGVVSDFAVPWPIFFFPRKLPGTSSVPVVPVYNWEIPTVTNRDHRSPNSRPMSGHLYRGTIEEYHRYFSIIPRSTEVYLCIFKSYRGMIQVRLTHT
jgi:hypothetical protein